MTLWSRQGAVLGTCTLAFFATMAARLVISPVVPSISDTFAVPNGAIGLALTGMWLGYALSQFPSGLLADRYGERGIILVAVGGTAVASTLLAFASSYAMFLVGTAVLGTVAGLHYSVATSLLTRTTDQIGTAIGIHTAGAPVAGVLAPMAAGAVGAWMGWRWAVALGTVFAAPVVGLVVYVVRARPPVRPDESVWGRFKIGPLAELLRRPPIARTVILSAVGMFVWQATASFLPTFFVAYHGYSEATAGVLFSGYFLMQGVTQPGLGALSDRIGRDAAASLAIGIGIVGYGLLVGGTGLGMAIVSVVCAGLSMGWGAALMPKFMDHLDDHERSAGFGLVRTVYMVLGASGSVVTGFVADVFGWGVAFVVLVLLLVGMLGALVQSTWRNQTERRAHAAP
ncbi:MFS transporter [Salinibacter ruber]|uniref:MFS transporter n=1 Tax=Salinibacter ruber TaxID=146919 RepID=UPI0021D44CE4|nr:MFS transporter [Salinibacter ruber]